jgi:hypothetical protein
MVTPATEHKAEREERLAKLVKDIDCAIMDGENLREHNQLALALLIRSMDIFSANYPEEDVVEIINFMFLDRREKRRLPTTTEYVAAAERTKKWLP